MAFRIEIQYGFDERCDECGLIDGKRPMLLIKSSCRETGPVQTWVHLDEFERKLAKLKAKKQT